MEPSNVMNKAQMRGLRVVRAEELFKMRKHLGSTVTSECKMVLI